MANQIIDKALNKIASIFCSVDGEAITNKTYPCFGYVTTSGTEVDLYLYLGKKFDISVITGVTNAYIRTASGGYVGGSGADLSQYIIRSSTENGGWILVRLRNTSGWGVTNNTPVCGQVNITGTIKGGVKPRVSSFFNGSIALPERGCA